MDRGVPETKTEGGRERSCYGASKQGADVHVATADRADSLVIRRSYVGTLGGSLTCWTECAKLRDAKRVGIRGGVQTLDGLPAASRDGFTADRRMSTRSAPLRRSGQQVSEPLSSRRYGM
jgi:hypothetical protein